MLTDRECRLAQPGPKPYKLSDSHGLFLAVLPTGTKSWRYKFRVRGAEKTLVIGPYPLFSLKDARAERDKARTKVVLGDDPAAEKRARKQRAKLGETFEEIARAWHASKLPTWVPRYGKEVLNRLERNVFRRIGGMMIGEITPPMVLELLRVIERRGAVTMAHEVRGHMSEVFVWAISSGLSDQDPAAIVRKALRPVVKGQREGLLQIDQLRKFIADIEAVPHAWWGTKLASRLLALTAVRPGVVRLAERKDMIDIDGPMPHWRVPAETMKLAKALKADPRYDFVVPLSRQAAELVKFAMQTSEHPHLIFPAEYSFNPMSDSTLSKLYRDAGYRDLHQPHGWRKSFSTVMNERVAIKGRENDRRVLNMMLAHMEGTVEIAYNRAGYMPRRRELVQEWADLLMQGAPPPETIRTGPRRKG